jgi:hypothetical protein
MPTPVHAAPPAWKTRAGGRRTDILLLNHLDFNDLDEADAG